MSGFRGAIELPDGVRLRARGLREPVPDGAGPQFGLYLGTGRTRRRHEPLLPWPQEWIGWPDFLVPLDGDHAVRAVVALHRRAREQAVEVACVGGVGRTGTVVACLAVLAGLSPEDAVGWTRAHYRPGAVETPWQRRWVTRFRAAAEGRPGGG